MDEHVRKHGEYKEQKDELNADQAQILFKKMDVIAMTTTGRAKQSVLLKGVTFPIVLVEEAAEVFEAHIVTALT